MANRVPDDPSRAVFGMKMVDSVLNDSLQQPRLNASLLGFFAASALLLASVGLYSLITLLVTAHRREIGVRIALGATAGEIMRIVFASAARLLATGLALGIKVTALAQRLLKTVLYGVSPLDSWTLTGAVGLLAAVSFLAAFLPARRAAAVDPLDAIRAK